VPEERIDVVKDGVDVGPDDNDVDDEPSGAVDSPAISDRTAEEKLPVIFARVNWAEKARKAIPLALLPLFDWKRIK